MGYVKKSKNIQAHIKKGWTTDKYQNDDNYIDIDIKDRYGSRIVEVKVLCDEWADIRAYKVYIGKELWIDFTINSKREYEYKETK